MIALIVGQKHGNVDLTLGVYYKCSCPEHGISGTGAGIDIPQEWRILRKKTGTFGIPGNPAGVPGVTNLRRKSVFPDFATENLAPGVEMVLLITILAVVRSAVLVRTSYGYSILSPPTVNLTLHGLAFMGLSATPSLR